MNILVTAGNTWAPIDKVRVITNIFTGKTGAAIAEEASRRQHVVTLLTSQPDVEQSEHRWHCIKYHTFDELRQLMVEHIAKGSFDAVIHSAAVSDYLATGVYSSNDMKSSLPQAAKIKSDEPELWIRLTRAPKLVDQVRCDWQFKGVLVKFKLEVGIDDENLLNIAERSRIQSRADLMVANTLEGAASWAFIGPRSGEYARIARSELAPRVIQAVEQLHKERAHA